MLLRAKTIDVQGWVPLLLRGCRDRSPIASTPIIIITKILADGKDYDTVAAVEGTAVAVHPERQIVASTKTQADGRPEANRRRGVDT